MGPGSLAQPGLEIAPLSATGGYPLQISGSGTRFDWLLDVSQKAALLVHSSQAFLAKQMTDEPLATRMCEATTIRS